MIDCDGGHVSFFTSNNVTTPQKRKLDNKKEVPLNQIVGADAWQFEGFHVTLDVTVDGEAGRMHHFYTEGGGIDLTRDSAPHGYSTWIQANEIACKVYKKIYNKDIWVGTLHKATGVYQQYSKALTPNTVEYETAKTYEFWK
jgi:hypothetical protein